MTTLISANLLSLASHLYNNKLKTSDNRSESFVSFIERQGLRGYLSKDQDLWSHLTGESQDIALANKREYALHATGFAFRCAMTLDKILTRLSEEEIPALIFKGISWSLLLHNDIATRPSGDIDILVPAQKSKRIRTILSELGYHQQQPTSPGQQLALHRFLKSQDFVGMGLPMLDLHHRLYSQWIALDTPFEDLWRRRTTVQPDGYPPMPTLSPCDAIVFTCLHSYQDGWSHLKGVLDLALFLERYQPDWQDLKSVSQERSPLVARAITFAVHLLGARAPKGWSEAFEPEQTLEHFQELFSLSEPPQLSLLRPDLWEGSKLRCLGKSAKTILNPSLDDTRSIDLPPTLVNLYILVRIFRLLQKLFSRRKLK